jgi:hypothetical protein
LMCVCGRPRLGRPESARFGACAAGAGTTGGFTNVCPWCGPG